MTNSYDLRQQLRDQLLSNNFHHFAAVCQDLLKAIGCEEVRLAGRLKFKGKNRDGGHDLEGYLAGPVRRRVIVQLKQFDPKHRVFQRAIDELRGVALRAGAAEAILITTGSLSSVLADIRPGLIQTLIPVRIIDGDELLDLLIAHQIGVVLLDDTLVFDDHYFQEQALACIDQGRQEAYRNRPPKEDELPTVTIRVESNQVVRYQFLP